MKTKKVKKTPRAAHCPEHQVGCEIVKTTMEKRDRYRANTGSRLVSGEYIPPWPG